MTAPVTTAQMDLAAALATTASQPVRWLRVARMLDSRQHRMIGNAHLVYGSNKILHAGAPPPPGALTAGLDCVELPGFTALPGLIDGHTHVALEGAELDAARRATYQQQDSATLLRLAVERMAITARLGVVAVRDGGDKDGVGLALSRITAAGESPLTRVCSPGPGIHRRGRYGSFFSRPIEDYPDEEACVRDLVAAGADHIKLVPTGIINFAAGQVTAAPQFQADEIRLFREAARRWDRHLMAHASGAEGIGHAIAGGVDTIEHGFFVTADQLARMRDLGIAWLPTFAPVREQIDHAGVIGWDDGVVDHLRRILENHAGSLQLALALGVNVLVGSDAGSWGVAHAAGLVREMELMQEAGMKPLDLLSQATFGNNQLLTRHPGLGTLEAGCLARFILTSRAVEQDVGLLRRPRWVVWDGRAESTETVPAAGL